MKQYKERVQALRDQCDDFLRNVRSIGNECAYTDRLLEAILATAQAIRKDYQNDGKP